MLSLQGATVMIEQSMDVGTAPCPVCLGRECGHFTADEKIAISAYHWRSWVDICCEDSAAIVHAAPAPRKTLSGWPV